MTFHDDKSASSDHAIAPTISPFKQLRERLGGISRDELAHRLGVASVTIGRWERGTHPPTFNVRQLKAFVRLLSEAGWEVEDFPENFTSATTQPANEKN